MKTRTFCRAGEALFGPLWQTRFAHALGVNDRTIRRWATGEIAIPVRVRTELVLLAEKRRQAVDEVIRLLRTEE
jgi:2-keto-3-deoxy-6-phosphogluconate aldolase